MLNQITLVVELPIAAYSPLLVLFSIPVHERHNENQCGNENEERNENRSAPITLMEQRSSAQGTSGQSKNHKEENEISQQFFRLGPGVRRFGLFAHEITVPKKRCSKKIRNP